MAYYLAAADLYDRVMRTPAGSSARCPWRLKASGPPRYLLGSKVREYLSPFETHEQ